MASLARPALLPQCSACTRRFSEYALDGWRPFQQHVRGKKKNANNPDFIHVQLLKDVRMYGRAGSIVPIKRAHMRNSWLHQRVADYVPWQQLRSMRAQGVRMDRDLAFMAEADLPTMTAEEAEGLRQASKDKRTITITQLSPQRTFELLQIFLPPTLGFTRPAVPKETADTTPSSAAVDVSSPGPSTPSPTQIYGSVSITDIAQEIQKAMATNDEASRVQVSDADIRFVIKENIPGREELEVQNRIKYLGEYEVEVQVRGLEEEEGAGLLRRRIRVAV